MEAKDEGAKGTEKIEREVAIKNISIVSLFEFWDVGIDVRCAAGDQRSMWPERVCK